MILSKASRLSLLAGLLCLLLMGFTGAANAVIRWDIFPSPSEVINSGRSEVLGGITFVVQNNQPSPIVTGNIAGGPSQIGVLFQNRMQIDNAMTTGIRLYTNNVALASTVAVCTSSCDPAKMWVTAQNIDSTGGGLFSGYLTINIPGGITLVAGDVVTVQGVRGRIDRSDLAAAGSDGYAQAQSINDPASNQFFPEQFRVAKSYIPMTVAVTSDVATLCLPTYGATTSSTRYPYLALQKITVTEVFPRAFIAKDSKQDVIADSTDRTDSYPAPSTGWLGSPTQGTKLKVFLNTIPATVTSVSWQPLVASNTGGGLYATTSETKFTAGTVGGPANGSAYMVYEYITSNQTGASDITTEGFDFRPALALSATNQQDATGVMVRAGVSLWPPPPDVQAASVLYQPYISSSAANTVLTYKSDGVTVSTTDSPAMPRFVTNYLSGSYAYVDPLSAGALANFGVYETFAPCVCYLLYPYTTKDSFWDTGIVVANTSDDTGAMAAGTGASRQAGRVTFWLYDFRLGAISPAAGIYFADTAHTAPLNQTGPAFDTAAQPIYYAGQSVRGLVSNLVTGAAATALANKGFTDFAGYIIAKAEFQFCHGYAFIADRTFANIAQGYVAGMIPDPTVKGGSRQAADAGDITNLKAGEGINN